MGHGPRTLAPVLRDRLLDAWNGGWSRTVLLRRAVAGVLAAVLALTPGARSDTGVATVVASRDLAAGDTLDGGAVRVVSLPPDLLPDLLPDGAATSVDAAADRVLAAPLRRGSPSPTSASPAPSSPAASRATRVR